MSLIVLTVVVAGCGPDTTQTDRDGGALAAPTATTDDAPSTERAASDASAPISVLAEAETAAPPSSAAPSVPPTPVASTAVTAPPASLEAEQPALPLPLPAPLDPEVVVPDSVSINTARVVVNQSNVAVSSGGSSARSIVESDAAVLVVQRTPAGLQIVSLEVRPGWMEAARSDSPERLTLRYVLGPAAVDISVWATDGGVSSSVSSSSDR